MRIRMLRLVALTLCVTLLVPPAMTSSQTLHPRRGSRSQLELLGAPG